MSASTTLEDIISSKTDSSISGDVRHWFETENGCPSIWLAFGHVDKPGVIDFGTAADTITLYLVDKQDRTLVQKFSAGDQLPAIDRELQTIHIAFPLSKISPSTEIYANVEHANRLRIQPRFLDQQEFERREKDAMIVHSWTIGAVSVIALFNLCLGLALRKSLFVYYALFVASLAVANFSFTGLGAVYLWPTQPHTSNFVREIGMVSNLVFAGAMFTAFLEGCEAKRIVRFGILYPSLAIVPVSTVWWLLDEWQAHIVISAWIGLAILSFTFAIMYLTWRRFTPAKLLLLPIFLICLPAFLAIFLPKNTPDELEIGMFSVRYILPVDHYFEAVMILDALLFSLLFAYRIRIVESEALKISDEMQSLQQSFSQKIIDTIDDERKRIAADLHDTAGQGLLAISTKLIHFTKDETLSSQQLAAIEQTADYSRGVVNEIRRISHDLHPAILDHVGWGAAIEELYENLSAHSAIDAKVDIEVADEALNDLQKIHLFRITQEMVSNVAKHASSNKHEGRFYKEDRHLIAEFIQDSQFDIFQPDEPLKHSLGFSIINQRVRSLGGKWRKTNANGRTIIKIAVPSCRSNPETIS